MTNIIGKHELGEVRKCDMEVNNQTGHAEERCSEYEERRKIMRLIEKDSSGFSNMVSDWKAGFTLEFLGPGTTVVTAVSTFRLKATPDRANEQQNQQMFHKTHQAILSGLKKYAEDQTG